jgi:tetratricopeptide (TPR) repeat protein
VASRLTQDATQKMKTYAIWGAVILMAISPAARAAEEPWKEVQSPHFRVLTNGTAGEARDVAREFEQMREVFVLMYPKFRLESGAPLLIFAAKDEETAKKLVPPLKKSPQGWMVAGLYRHGWEKNYAVVRLDSWGQGAHETVYHEYAHSILHLNAHYLPTWLDEGLAEFFAYTRFQGDKIYIGAATERYRTLPRPSIPIEALIGQRGSFQHSEYGTQMFYLESWALVHFMTFGPGMENGAKLSRFYALLQKGEEQKRAFEEAFGDIAVMDKALVEYMGHLAFTTGVVNNPVRFDEKQFPARTMGAAESEASIAEAELALGGRDAARPWVEQALRDDPNLGVAHEDSGFVLFAEGKDEEAAAQFSKAYDLDQSLYLSLFFKTMLSPAAKSASPVDQEATHAALSKVLDINPEFAPAVVQLACLALRQRNVNGALALSRRAEELEPSRAGYHILSGQILLRMGKGAEAAAFAKYVADRWPVPDHNEAVELWNAVPESDRPAAALVMEAPANTKDATGIVKSAACSQAGGGTISIADSEGKLQQFHWKVPIVGGFSDTIWYGEDHFSYCNHLEGTRALIHYKAPSDGSYAGDAMSIEIRNDLPSTQTTAINESP